MRTLWQFFCLFMSPWLWHRAAKALIIRMTPEQKTITGSVFIDELKLNAKDNRQRLKAEWMEKCLKEVYKDCQLASEHGKESISFVSPGLPYHLEEEVYRLLEPILNKEGLTTRFMWKYESLKEDPYLYIRLDN